jgi:hypothetical protein
MIFLLIVFKDNWADEFDCEGFSFVKINEWETIKKEAELCDFPQEVCFGTNEYFLYDSAKEFLSKFKVTTHVSDVEMIELRRSLGMYETEDTFGICPYSALEGLAPDEYYDEEGNFVGKK